MDQRADELQCEQEPWGKSLVWHADDGYPVAASCFPEKDNLDCLLRFYRLFNDFNCALGIIIARKEPNRFQSFRVFAHRRMAWTDQMYKRV